MSWAAFLMPSRWLQEKQTRSSAPSATTRRRIRTPSFALEGDRFFLPIFFNLAKSIYESPYYWMLRDSKYKETGLSNRGDATEEIAFDLLTRVFGEENVRRGVKIRNRNQDVTDIDVLAVAGNKAVIVQAKSKKLTMASRGGDGESLKGDFQEAVQDD